MKMLLHDRIQKLDDYLIECIDEGVFPGVGYAIVTKQSKHINELGYAQVIPNKVKLKTNTIFDLASLTKVVATTTCIMLLIEYGEISLDTKIKTILPEFKHGDITISKLLTHTSGLPSLKRYYKECSDVEELKQYLYNIDLIYSVGKQVVYSDLGFMLLGLIIERITGSFVYFAEEELFKPLNMKDTCFNPPADKIERCASTELKEERGTIRGRVHDGNAYFIGGVSGHAGLFSNVEDLSHFAEMILNYGSYNNKSILNPKTIQLMRHCFTKDLNKKRGLGWIVNSDFSCCDLASNKALYHTGFTGTSILIDEDYSFILLTNRVHPTRSNTKLMMVRKFINNMASGAIV